MRLQDWVRVLGSPDLSERQREALTYKPGIKKDNGWKAKAANRTIIYGLKSKSPMIRMLAYLSLESSALFPEIFLPDVQRAFKSFLETTLREEKQRIAQEEANKSRQQLREEIRQQNAFVEQPKWMGIPIEPAYSSYKIYREVRLKPLYDQFIRSYGCKPSGLIIGTRVAATIIYLREQEKEEKFWEQLPHTRKEWLQFIADPLRLFPTVDPYSLDRVDFLLPNEFSILATVNELSRLEHIVYGSSDVDPEEAIARVIQKAYRNAGDTDDE